MRLLALVIPAAVQTIGVALALVGIYLVFGVGWALLLGGVSIVVYGMLLENGWLSARR